MGAVGYLRDFARDLGNDIGLGPVDESGRLVIPDSKLFGEYTNLLARCHVELGQWQSSLRESEQIVSFGTISDSELR